MKTDYLPLIKGMDYLLTETRMLTGLAVAYGTSGTAEYTYSGLAQESDFSVAGFPYAPRLLKPDALFDLASLTKLFTAVLTLQLAEDHLLSLEDTIAHLDPRFPHLADISIYELMTFQVNPQTDGRLDNAPSRKDALNRLFASSPAPLPTIRVYSDIPAMILSRILESVTSLPYATLLQRKILEPLGMTETFCRIPEAFRSRCVNYSGEHRLISGRYSLRTIPSPGIPHDPKALLLQGDTSDCFGHAGVFSTLSDMISFSQGLLSGRLLSPASLRLMGTNRVGRNNGDGTHRQYLGTLCFTHHPEQRLSEVPVFFSPQAFAISGFTGNHLSLDPERGLFILFLGNRVHGRLTRVSPLEDMPRIGLSDGVGTVNWPDGRIVPSSAQYVYFKDSMLNEPIRQRMVELQWL